jgi:hypothetical protein
MRMDGSGCLAGLVGGESFTQLPQSVTDVDNAFGDY